MPGIFLGIKSGGRLRLSDISEPVAFNTVK
jgi:hypothetical protein